MTEIACDLKQRFDFAVYWFHEKCELDPGSLLDGQTIVDLSDDEARAVKILETLREHHRCNSAVADQRDGGTSRRLAGII
jgi:hypothetical protein